MTSVALEWRGIIKSDWFVAHEFHERVTLVTLHARVTSRERHLRALVVIKSGRNPALRIVAGFARRLSCAILELSAMRLHVA